MNKKITLCMIAKNEEFFLSDCLNSVKDLVDEIILVDTGSSDRTVEIAKSFGAKVYFFEWCDDFSKPRNLSLSKATGDWILVLDADEIVTKEDCEKIRKFINKEEFIAVQIQQRTYAYITHSFSFYENSINLKESRGMPFYSQTRIVRLFKNHESFFFQGVVHELVEMSIEDKGHKIFPSDIIVHHYCQYDKKRSFNKRLFYLRIATKKAKLNPDDALAWFQLAKEYVQHKMYNRALSCLRLAESLKINSNTILCALIFYNKGLIYETLGKHSESEKEFINAVKEYSTFIRAYLALIRIYEKQSNYILASEVYFKLGKIQLSINKLAPALESLKKAISYNPMNKDAKDLLNQISSSHI